MTIREEFAAAIAAAWDGTPPRILAAARPVDALTEPVLMLERTTVAKASNAMGGYLVTFTLHAVVPTQDRDRQDTALDELLDGLLAALDGISWCHWDTATRSVFLDTWPSFQVSAITITERTKGV